MSSRTTHGGRRGGVGFEATVAWARELRGRLTDLTGEPAHFSWFLRMDPQVARVHGSPTWVAETYGRELAELRAAGDAIGGHTHAWRWQDPPGRWLADWADAAWVDHCLETCLTAHATSFGEPSRAHRFGDRYLSARVLPALRAGGVRVDLTVEPGARPVQSLYRGWVTSARPPDFAAAPRVPYLPRDDDPLRPSDDPAPPGPWMLPLTSVDAGDELPLWPRVGRAVRYPGRVRHRPVALWAPWRTERFWPLIERDLDASPSPYLTFAVRSDALIKPWAAGPLREKFEALSATTLVRRLRFTDPESAIAQLNGA